MDSFTNPLPGSGSINDLRLPQNFGEQFSVKRILTAVAVGKPSAPRFFRTKPSQEMVFDALLVEDKAGGGHYIVTAPIAGILGKLARPIRLYAGIDRSDYPFLIPIPLPDETGRRNPWHESLLRAVEAAESNWVRVTANRALGMYDVFQAEAKLPEPNWPEISMEELVEKAFAGRIVTSADHPIVQGLLGRI